MVEPPVELNEFQDMFPEDWGCIDCDDEGKEPEDEDGRDWSTGTVPLCWGMVWTKAAMMSSHERTRRRQMAVGLHKSTRQKRQTQARETS